MMNGGYGAYVPGAQSFTKALQAAPGTGSAKVNWSSNNFSITHQKSVIIDAADASGAPLAANALPTATAQLVISTGNFNGYQGAHFYAARDYAMVTKDPKLIATVESAFSSDFGCAGSTVINPANLTVADRLVWSNGTTGANVGQTGSYPPGADYPPPSSLAGSAQDQGNAQSEWLAVIGAAGPKASVHLFAKSDSVLYIHSKFASVNGSDAVVGSQNFSQTSLEFNRELGVRLGNEDQSAIAVLTGTFDTDWAATANVTVLPSASPAPPSATSLSSAQQHILTNVGAPPKGTANQTCGPIAVS
ncbi:MAG: phospholipase D-like domain-containing protein [Actinomycetes bacterium]